MVFDVDFNVFFDVVFDVILEVYLDVIFEVGLVSVSYAFSRYFANLEFSKKRSFPYGFYRF